MFRTKKSNSRRITKLKRRKAYYSRPKKDVSIHNWLFSIIGFCKCLGNVPASLFSKKYFVILNLLQLFYSGLQIGFLDSNNRTIFMDLFFQPIVIMATVNNRKQFVNIHIGWDMIFLFFINKFNLHTHSVNIILESN